MILSAILTHPVTGQTETLELQLKLERGETLYYKSFLSMEMSMQLPNAQQTATTNMEGRLAERVLDVDPDGTMVVEGVMEDFRVTIEGRTESEVAPPVVSKIRPDGRLVEIQGSNELNMLVDTAGWFPGHPVSVGESWSGHGSTQFQIFAAEMNSTSTLSSVDQTGDGRTAHIRTRAEGTVKTLDLPVPQGMQIQGSGTVHGSGENVWSVERGRLLRSEFEGTVDIRLEMTAGGRTVRGNGTTRFSAHLEALPRDKVVTAPVSADALIVPGKAVGPFALDHGMNDLVNKLGPAGSGASAPDETMWGADRGFRSAEASWPNGLVAYVDWENRSTLLGLGVADRRFRTDKDLGFGSSMGAVLFAHGMSPIRLDMTSSVGFPGAVKVLIYNDAGIAYAITVEDKHVTIKGRRAPAGAVAWVVIFPPGSAGKIFPLP